MGKEVSTVQSVQMIADLSFSFRSYFISLLLTRPSPDLVDITTEPAMKHPGDMSAD